MTLLIILLVIAALGGGIGHGRFGFAGGSPAAISGVGLVLLAVTVFVVGAILGEWAGVVRIWPVRYALQLIDGAPKPIVPKAASRRLAHDSAGRLRTVAGKSELPSA